MNYMSNTGMSVGIQVCVIHFPTVRGSAALCWPQTVIASFKKKKKSRALLSEVGKELQTKPKISSTDNRAYHD